MISKILVIAAFAFTAIVVSAGAAVPPIQIDSDGPTENTLVLDLQESWRVGGEDEDVIFGRITDLKMDTNGDLYILDNQICQVVVISSEGEHLRDLSRQGDGPGELRQPIGLVLLPDDLVGIGLGFPGKMAVLKKDGTPVTTHYPIGEPAEGRIGVMISLGYADGTLIATGGRIIFEGPENSRTLRFMAVSDSDFTEFPHIIEKTTPIDPTGRHFVESDNYFIDQNWAAGPDGRIFVPMTRDAYEVSVFDRTGELLQVFGREYTPRRRTDEDKRAVSPVINATGGRDDDEWNIEDHDPCIQRIMIDPADQSLWILSGHGNNDQPDGILETWDVFTREGEYLRQVAIPLGHEMNEGTSYLVGNNRLVVVRGTGSVFSGGDPEDEDEETEVEPLEVICYEIR